MCDSTTNLTDETRLFDVNMNDLTAFAMLLEEKQGPLLRKLSNAVTPALSALAAFHQGHDMDLPPSLIEIESLKDRPKALLTLSPGVSHAIEVQS